MPEWFETFEKCLWLRDREDRDDEADFLRRALGLRAGDHVLDAPCGAGHVAVHLAREGVRVTGVDRNPAFIRRARRRLRDERLPGEFFVGDLRRLDFDANFDAAFNWGGSFGYFSDAENLDVLRRLACAVRRGGRVLVDQVNRERVLRRFCPRFRRGELTVRNRWDLRTERVEGRWTVSLDGRRRTSRSSIRLYTPGQFRRLFEQGGLGDVRLYDGRQGAPYRRGARRIVAVGRRTQGRRVASPAEEGGTVKP